MAERKTGQAGQSEPGKIFAEIFSPPRMVSMMISTLNLAVLMPAVLSIDFLTGFDLRMPNVRAEVMQSLKMHQIQVVVLSPPSQCFPK